MNKESNNTPTLIMTVGAPASGKSTYSKKYALGNNFVYLSADEARAKFGYGEGDQSVSKIAFDYVKTRMIDELNRGNNVLIDATCMYRKARNFFLRDVKESINKICFLFEVNREELIKRDANRPRTVGVGVIDMMLNKYQPPTLDEYNEIIKL